MAFWTRKDKDPEDWTRGYEKPPFHMLVNLPDGGWQAEGDWREGLTPSYLLMRPNSGKQMETSLLMAHSSMPEVEGLLGQRGQQAPQPHSKGNMDVASESKGPES